MAERGTGGTIPCPGCLEQHRAVYHLAGLAVLDCPSVETPGELRMRSVPRTAHSSTFVFLRGPEHAPVDAQMPQADAEQLLEVPATGGLLTSAEDTTKHRRRTA